MTFPWSFLWCRSRQVGNVKALVLWATGKRLTYRLPKLSLITLFPPFEQRDSWSSYGAIRAYSGVLLYSLGTQGERFMRFELTTNDPRSVDDAICEGISPLGYW